MKSFVYFFILIHITSIHAGDHDIPENTHNRQERSPILHTASLLNAHECQDLASLCSHVKVDDDLSVLECIQTLQSSQLESLPDECQSQIWTQTRNIISDEIVAELTKKACNKQSQKFIGCKPESKNGVYLACLVEKLDDIKEGSACQNIIQRLQSIAFTDFHLIVNFMDDCAEDVELHTCGRLNADREKVSQGETIACLQENINSLRDKCKKRVLRVSEQQSDNLKLDHQFFLACAADSIRFCPEERPGSVGVFKCLVKPKHRVELTSKCRDQIIRRDKLLAHDYKISRGLARACHEDIKINHCRRGVSNDKNVRLAQILLCLESVVKNGTKLSDECQVEINEHRQMLMMDYQLSPEILTGCADDIPKFCGDIGVHSSAGGEIIHCLMEHARQKRRRDRRITSTCQRAIEQLIKVSDVGEDWRVDPVLRRACKPVVDIACRDTDGGDARVMSCLMEHIGTQVMIPQCESALMLIQYFVARDFKLDPQLYRNCRDDAIKYCSAKKTWDDANNGQMDPERGPLVLPCLHRIAYSDDQTVELKKECFQEVKRVMRQRAISVDLIPEVEDHCLEDLSSLCSDKIEKGAEMQCLQDNLEKLEQKCKEAVTSFTEQEAAHVELNPVIMSVCRGAMDKHCAHIFKNTKEQGDMMECLISHKNDPDMRQDQKCHAAIEHFQIISLKNYHFTYKFKEECRPFVSRFCAASTTKYDVVSCLSEVMRNNTITGRRHTISKQCRQQVKNQLLQQRENIDFDPKLKNACKKEIVEICGRSPSGGGQVIECLQTNSKLLGEGCRHAVFKLKKSELGDSDTDYTLVNACKDMTYKYCQNTESDKLLDCLKLYKNEPLFDPQCHVVILNRMIEQNTDFRFNPALQSACKRNIAKYCSHIVATAKPNEELNGKMVNCLKAKFREAKLDQECEQKMIEVLQEQALNYKLNPLLQSLCKSEIQVLCKPSNDIEEHGEVEECLKNAFLSQKTMTRECKIEVATLIQEAKADIHVDPLLHRACTEDLLKYCSNVKSGDGRQLKCLQVILQDESKAMKEDCRNKLSKRMEMFRNAETLLALPPENMEQLVSQVVTSPAKKYFLIVLMSCIGTTFIFGLFCGRVTKRTIAQKNK